MDGRALARGGPVQAQRPDAVAARAFQAAEELYCKALDIAKEQEARIWELRAAVSLARLRRDQGRRAEARNLLAPIYGWFTEGFDTPDLKEVKALLDELR
jgi:predicted ATPase